MRPPPFHCQLRCVIHSARDRPTNSIAILLSQSPAHSGLVFMGAHFGVAHCLKPPEGRMSKGDSIRPGFTGRQFQLERVQ